MENKRAPLSVKNTVSTGIPRPSRLPQPGSQLPRKRPLPQNGPTETEGKENAPMPKRAKTMTKVNVIKKPAPTKPLSKTKTTTTMRSAPGKVVTKPVTKKTAAGASRAKPSTTAMSGKQKRPAWDVKGKLEDMAEEQKMSASTIGGLQVQLTSFAGRLGELEALKETQASTIKVKQEENSVAYTQIKDLEKRLATTLKKLEAVEQTKTTVEARANELENSLTASRAEVASLKSALMQMTANMSAVQCELDATKIARDSALKDGADKALVISNLQKDIQDHLTTIDEHQIKGREDEMLRRTLHNTIQELKGNIRVFCRVRPLLPSDPNYITGRESSASGGSSKSGDGGQRTLAIMYPDKDNNRQNVSLEMTSQDKTKSYDFTFDQVFGPDSSQETVFHEISQLVQSALDGYNVCIFAYGQTGSGKTYTMEGPEDKGQSNAGMISRAVNQVFSSSLELRERGWEYKMEASFLEIYNESLRDLLASTAGASVDIKIDPKRQGEVYVTNVTPCVVTSQDQVQKLLERAAKNRAVAATQCNDRSSRSHSVFMLKINGKNEETGETCRGVLNLVDLAGSERLSQSGSKGERLKETKSINKSLSTLGAVIMALANKDSHIPYRNSKLTYLLQNSLGGNSKTLMFVNMSPQVDSLQETLCSLRFATQVNQCSIGTARKSIK